jgi:hypothetical protein
MITFLVEKLCITQETENVDRGTSGVQQVELNVGINQHNSTECITVAIWNTTDKCVACLEYEAYGMVFHFSNEAMAFLAAVSVVNYGREVTGHDYKVFHTSSYDMKHESSNFLTTRIFFIACLCLCSRD